MKNKNALGQRPPWANKFNDEERVDNAFNRWVNERLVMFQRLITWMKHLCDFEVQCFTTELADGANTAACLLHVTLSNCFLPPNELSSISDWIFGAPWLYKALTLTSVLSISRREKRTRNSLNHLLSEEPVKVFGGHTFPLQPLGMYYSCILLKIKRLVSNVCQIIVLIYTSHITTIFAIPDYFRCWPKHCSTQRAPDWPWFKLVSHCAYLFYTSFSVMVFSFRIVFQ